jgi:Cu/Ag efflux protein CusF
MRILLRSSLAVVFCFALGLTSCSKATDAKHYDARGIIRSFTPDHRMVEIEHEDVGDYMPAMTMTFEVQDPKTTADLKVGDAVSFRLAVAKGRAAVERMNKISADQVHLGGTSPTPH